MRGLTTKPVAAAILRSPRRPPGPHPAPISVSRPCGGGLFGSLDDIGIDKYGQSYYPPAPLNEHFGSLFKIAPKIELELVRTLANHAMEGWRQVHELRKAWGDRPLGTPIPLELELL